MLAPFVFPDTLSAVATPLDGDHGRPVDAARPTDIYDLDGVKALDQSLFSPGHSVENLAHNMHGNDEYFSVVEFPTRNLFKKAGEWALKMSFSIQ
jgi:hypothetical protein